MVGRAVQVLAGGIVAPAVVEVRAHEPGQMIISLAGPTLLCVHSVVYGSAEVGKTVQLLAAGLKRPPSLIYKD